MKTARLVAFGVALTAVAVAPAAAAAAPHRLHTQTARQGSVRAEFSFRDVGSGSTWWDHARIKIWNHGRLIVNRTNLSARHPPSGTTRPSRTAASRSASSTAPARPRSC